MAMRAVTTAVWCVLIWLVAAGWPVASAQTSQVIPSGESPFDFKDFVDVTTKLITAVATILAGAWAYYRFVKGRVFKSRLTVSISARRARICDVDYVISLIEVANVGLSRIDLYVPSLRITAISGKPIPKSVSLPSFDWLRTVPVLRAHTFIESGEKLTEPSIFIIDGNLPVMISLKITISESNFPHIFRMKSENKRVTFTASTVVEQYNIIVSNEESDN